MEQLQNYYDEHAAQARQHENQRESMTNILIGVAGLLVGLVTFAELAMWSLPAAFTVIALGIYGFFFSGKHYERFKFHTSIMKATRDEIDRLEKEPKEPAATPASLKDLRGRGVHSHYKKFDWPQFRGPDSGSQSSAKSWIARQRLHVFWEGVHILIALIGLILCAAILAKLL